MLNHVLLQAQQGASPHWRYHLEGVQKIITLRGGNRALARSKQLLLCFLLYVVVGKNEAEKT